VGDRPVEQDERVPAALARELGAQEQSAHDALPRVEALRRLAAGPGMLGGQELGPDAADDAGRDLVLDGEDVVEAPVVALGPEVVAGRRLDELGRHPDPVGRLADAAPEDVPDPELAADGPGVYRLPLVGERRVAGDHEEALELGQRGGGVLGDPVGEELLPGLRAHVVERQHGDRRPVGEGGRGWCGHTARDDPVHPHGSFDALKPPLAEVLEVTAEPAPEVVVGGAGDDHAAGLRELLEAGRDVHAVAVEVAVGLVDDVAEVDADPEADALVLGDVPLPLGHASLHEDGAADRVDDAGELAERAVAHELDDAAPVLGDERPDELLAVGLEALEGPALVPLHQARVADHVGRQNGGEPTLDPRRRHGRPSAGGRWPAYRPIEAKA
jgi:hypothetical protein